MASHWKQGLFGLLCFVLSSAIAPASLWQAHAALGDEVTNIATVTQDTATGRLVVSSNPATFVVQAQTTPSQVDFFRIAAGAPDAMAIVLNGADYSPTGDLSGPFTAVTAPAGAGLSLPVIASSVDLVPAETYLSGEIMVIRVSDAGQNGDPGAIETVVTTVQADNGDTITLRLYESGPNTGEFFAFFVSSPDATAQNDPVMTAPQDTVLTATYVDVFDSTEISVDTALVDPFGRVFDSFTGQLLDGVLVSIVDAATGAPAQVFGIDGVSAYPSALITGTLVTDASGRTYQLSAGEFLFPLMAPGDYRLEINAPEGYLFPSVRDASDFDTLQNAPFEIIAGSYGASFTVLATGPLNLDVPLDPNGDLIVRKDASEEVASIGDFLGYTVELENGGNVPAPFNLQDILPPGIRYVGGTARLNGVEVADPQISSDGRTLAFATGLVLPGETTRLTYLTTVGPGTPEGEIVNRATALNSNGETLSNTAEAAVTIADDLLQSRLIIVGRVADAACAPEADWARALEDGKGVAGVRLYMETGRYVVTDENGLYHFEGIEPGTHVVQVDEATLPRGYEPVICEENSRYAGSAVSKFVDARGGTIWRANFYLTKKKPQEVTDYLPRTYRASPVEGKVDAVADGESRPQITIQVQDTNGDPVPEGRSVRLEIAAPYTLASSDTHVGENGEVSFELEPTDLSGELSLEVKFVGDETDFIPVTRMILPEAPKPEPGRELEQLSSTEIYDQAWLDAQTGSDPRWVYPRDGDTPDGRSVDIGLLHNPNHKIALYLNGKAAGAINFSGSDVSSTGEAAISRWQGVDIQRGRNLLRAEIRTRDDDPVAILERDIWFADEVHAAILVDDQTDAVADGRTRPVIAVRLEDLGGHAIHGGRIVDISVAEPYRLAQAAEQEFEAPIDSAFSNVAGVRVGAQGIAYVELEPTLQAGRVRLNVQLHDDRSEVIEAWLTPEKREWVVVGLAEAEGLLSNLEDGETSADGRIAFFAKGMIKGDWLMTVAIDTAKRRGDQDTELFDEIDPNAYYTLYGDQTWQYNDAESRYPLYVKLERETVQFLFGDYETDLTDTQLGRYSRRLSGFKTAIETDNVSVTAFAAESNQSFIKDEIAADGTSGPYRLIQAPLVRASETITIETRDRFRPDVIVSTRTLSRYIDYEIDYVTGELLFRHPVDAADFSLNPNVIVVDYETSADVSRDVTAGGRVAGRILDGNLEAGVSAILENDSAAGDADASHLIAVDVTLTPDSQTEIRAEAAISEADTDTGRQNGEAWLVEATRRSAGLSLTGYYREESANFGLGQQSTSTSALRRIGAQLSAELGVKDLSDSNDRQVRRIDAQAYREENLDTGSSRDVADLTVRQESQTFGASLGVRAIAEEFGQQTDPRQSILLTGSLSKTFVEQGLTLSATHEEPVLESGSETDQATLFPGRTIVGLDKTLGRQATFSARHEVTHGGDTAGETTIAGINWSPWTGGQLRAASDMITEDSARRLGATLGVDQTWQIGEQWSLSTGLTRRAEIENDGDPLDVDEDTEDASFASGYGRSLAVADEAYTSGYLGFGYRSEKTAGSGRVEMRDSTTGQRALVSLGGARELTETLSFSAKARYQSENLSESADSESLDIRMGAAWRPRGEGTILFNRFDIGHDKIDGVSQKSKAVNNLALNTMLTDRTQVSLYHGIKYVEAEYNGAKAEGFTHLLGAEMRHDITETIDLGGHVFWNSGEASKTAAWSIGPSIGFTPRDNVWLSVGWNFEGFEDDDFEAASYTRSGPNLKIRAKFDAGTIEGLVDRLGLGRD